MMSVVFGVLFLPAASHCWSNSSSTPHPTGFSRAYAVYFWGISLSAGTAAMDRVTRLGVRLASRLGLPVVVSLVLVFCSCPLPMEAQVFIIGRGTPLGRKALL